ncbi:hypothetical protein FHL15_002079 [Xylaria flabelliformis]|uniref:Uncharacterized protein n=1 Tax=Xylaria flabelliformis TaxID=2512241 RepID=A0A553IAQ8_9PEZI|nr:hypothetical protein FHL15_002079 [Xylaria flabelliformis]
MGLPLFIPPVESDVPAKPEPKRPADPSHTRSPIRRTERRRQLNEARERRLRMVDAMQAADYASPRHVRSALQPPSTRSVSRPADAPREPERRSPRLENPRISELTQHLDLERRYLSRSTTELPRVFSIDPISDDPHLHFSPEASGAQMSEWSLSPHSFQRVDALTSHIPGRSLWRRESNRDSEESRYRHRSSRDRLRQLQLQGEAQSLEAQISARREAALRRAQRARYLDGLGDRDRSLSPEVWDTLQSTLTPDPQPPSVGSSFASTVVSATASQAHGSDSANTSITAPDEEIEPPCDPVIENSGSDSEDDVGGRLIEPSRQPTPRARRSYADVVAEPQSRQSPESADTIDHDREWLSGMHRIVRGLASRGDIPDEWWAQAGLSRSMSWEDAS